MKHRVEVDLILADDQLAGDRVLVKWTGRYGTADPDEEVQVISGPLFPKRSGRFGKGITPKGRGTKAAGPAPQMVAGKGQMPKGLGPKGGSLRMVRMAVLVPPVTGLRTFGVRTFDLAGNEQTVGNPTVTAMVSAVPPRPGPAVYDSYDAGNDAVTVRVGDRRQ